MTTRPAHLLPLLGVELWRVDLDLGAEHVERCAALLSDSERARACRLLAGPVRDRFVVARAALREIVGEVVGLPAAEVEFAAGPHGKPELRGGPWFNMSHSGGLAVIALDADRAVGVDVEAIRVVPEEIEIATAQFTPGEQAMWRRRREAGEPFAFLSVWTRREAWLKALGTGIGNAPPDATADLGWSIAEFTLAPGHVAALAVDDVPGGTRAL